MSRGSAGWSRPTVVVTVAAVFAAALSGCSSDSGSDAAPDDAEVLVALPLKVDDGPVTAAASARSFVPLAQVAADFGASAETISAAVARLGDLGVTVAADPTGAALWGQVDVQTAEHVFGVELVVEEVDGVRTIQPSGTPSVPDGVEGITAIVGLTKSMGETDATDATGATDAGVPGAGCPADIETADDLARQFGAGTPAATDGRSPDDVTVAVLTVERYVPAVATTYANCAGSGPDAARVKATSVVPLAPDAAGGPELALDTLVIGTLAPTATIEITRFDRATSLVFPLLQALEDAAGSGTTPEALVFTVGYCEAELSDAELDLAEWLLAALAATGTTAIAATGDQGSSACHPGSDAAAVQYPAASSWVTAVGGASFGGSVSSPTDLTTWNDTPTAEQAGGGGVSKRVPRPAWQTSLPVDGTGVAVPDVVAFAEPDGFGAIPVCTDSSTCTWQQLGGTSLAAAGLGGVLAHYLAGTGTRLGALSATLAEIANAGRAPAIDVTAGDNHVFTSTCCTAATGFDLATGWGLFDATRLPASVSG